MSATGRETIKGKRSSKMPGAGYYVAAFASLSAVADVAGASATA